MRFCFCVAFYFFSFSDKSAACFALAGLLKSSLGWVVQQCDINCCNGTNCNTNVSILSQNATNVLRRDGKECLPLSLIWDCSVEHRLNFPPIKFRRLRVIRLRGKTSPSRIRNQFSVGCIEFSVFLLCSQGFFHGFSDFLRSHKTYKVDL